MQDLIRQEMLVALCLMAEGEKGKALFQFAALDEVGSLERISHRLLRGTLDRRLLKDRIRNLTRYGCRLGLEEVHPGWILEHLRAESPRIVALLSQFLSTPKAEFILSHLTFEERQRFPQSSRAVAPEIVAIVRSLIEKKLGLTPLKSDESFSFSHLGTLKGEDLKALFRDLGIEEVGRAFRGVEPQVLRTFLSRFNLSEATEIRKRLKESLEVSATERRAAQRHLLSLSFDHLPAERFFLEIGCSVFARALTSDEVSWAEGLSQKLTVGEGYRFKRLLQERQKVNREESDRVKEEVMKRLFVLAKQGKVKRYWKEETEIEPTVIFQEGQA